MRVNNKKDMLKVGVYEILNMISGKSYIGSTMMTFKKRKMHHVSMLRANKHKNIHLQRSFNKHGEDNFIFNILEVTDKESTLEREQEWIDISNCVERGFNINPVASGTPNLSREVIEKRTKTFTKTLRKGLEYYYKVKARELTINDVPEKYKVIVTQRLSAIPWNKGMSGYNNDYPKHRKSMPRSNFFKNNIKAESNIQVFKNGKLLVSYINISELVKASLKEDFYLKKFMILRNKEGRNGTKPYVLKSKNIIISCSSGKVFKGLEFRYKE